MCAQDIRTALHGSARLIRAAFPHAVSEVPPLEPSALVESDDDARPIPLTPKRGSDSGEAAPSSPAAMPMTPLHLVIESPRAS